MGFQYPFSEKWYVIGLVVGQHYEFIQYPGTPLLFIEWLLGVETSFHMFYIIFPRSRLLARLLQPAVEVRLMFLMFYFCKLIYRLIHTLNLSHYSLCYLHILCS